MEDNNYNDNDPSSSQLQPPSHCRSSPSSRRNHNTIVQTFSLYSPECVQHLQQALRLLEQPNDAKNALTTVVVSPSRFHHASDDNVVNDDSFDDHPPSRYNNNDSGSDDSKEDEEEEEDSQDEEERDSFQNLNEGMMVHNDDTINATTTPPPPINQKLPLSSLSTATNSKPHLNVSNPTFHPSIIRKHVDALSTMSFEIVDDHTATQADDQNTTTTNTNTNTKNTNTNTNATRNQIELPTCLLSKEQLQYDNTTEQCRAYSQLAISIIQQSKPIIVLLIRSGRFAGAVFQTNPNQSNSHHLTHGSCCCTHHRTSVRYTVRKGQGKAQSSQDAQGRKAISIGSQLRRQGEIQLRDDIHRTILEWKDLFHNAALILISVPRTMQKGLFDSDNNHHHSILSRTDPRIRRIPLDVGRPSYENACLIFEVVMTVTIRPYHPMVTKTTTTSTTSTNSTTMTITTTTPTMIHSNKNDNEKISKVNETGQIVNDNEHDDVDNVEIVPLSVLHIAAQNGDVATLESLLENGETVSNVVDTNNDDDDDPVALSLLIDQPAGLEQMTPLHYAAASCSSNSSIITSSSSSSSTNPSVDPNNAATCVRLLLERGHANPCVLDQRRRVPYTLALQNDKVRDAFRISRAILGEDYCDWDHEAKVGSPLSLDDLNDKLEKEAEKRRKKRLKQKEKKAREKAEEQAAEERRLALEEQRMKEEEAKRIRDGLQPKATTVPGGKACDYCQTICVGKKRINMFQRLDYSYCTSVCLQNHKRDLMAAAAMTRMTTNVSADSLGSR